MYVGFEPNYFSSVSCDGSNRGTVIGEGGVSPTSANHDWQVPGEELPHHFIHD